MPPVSTVPAATVDYESMSKRKRLDYDQPTSNSGNDDASPPDDALLRSLRERRWNLARALLRRDDAVRFVHRSDEENGADGDGIGRRDPLRCACYHYAPVDVVRSIFALTRTTTDGRHPCWTALHEACCYSSEDVVSFLLDVTPAATAVPDGEGKLPLYLAVEFRRSPSVVGKLLRVHPTAARVKDSRGIDPLRRFFARWEGPLQRRIGGGVGVNGRCRPRRPQRAVVGASSAPSDDVEGRLLTTTFSLLLRARVAGTVESSDGDDWAPFLEALRSDDVSSVMLLYLLTTLPPDATSRKDRDGNYALHLAAAMTSPMKPDPNVKRKLGVI